MDKNVMTAIRCCVSEEDEDQALQELADEASVSGIDFLLGQYWEDETGDFLDNEISNLLEKGDLGYKRYFWEKFCSLYPELAFDLDNYPEDEE